MPELPPVPTPIGDGQIEFVELRIKMDATLTVQTASAQPTEWIKPGVEAAIRWRGPEAPAEMQLRAGAQFLQGTMIAPHLEELIVMVSDGLQRARRG